MVGAPFQLQNFLLILHINVGAAAGPSPRFASFAFRPTRPGSSFVTFVAFLVLWAGIPFVAFWTSWSSSPLVAFRTLRAGIPLRTYGTA